MKLREQLPRFLAAASLLVAAGSLVSCLSTDLGPEEMPFDEPDSEPTGEPAPTQWEIRSGLGTADEYTRTGGVNEEAFWRANAAEVGVTILPSGLRYRVIRRGDGPLVGDAPRVAVSYVTSALSGTRLADSRTEGGAVELEVARMNPGWREAVPQMREGAIWRLYVPAALGRSSTDLGSVKSRIYDVEIVHVMADDPGPVDGRFP